jgi:hypothetical protein
MGRVEITEIVLLQQSVLRAVTDADVTVTARDGSPVTVYAAETGIETLTQPLRTTLGRIDGWLELGSYNLEVDYNGTQFTQPFEAISGDAIAGLDLGSFGTGAYVDGVVWPEDREYRSGNKDGVYFIAAFEDNSGSDSPITYSKLFGGYGSKIGPGNHDSFWTSIQHYGDGEAGLFIGDVTAHADGEAGNIWGGHFRLTANVAANMRGLHIELIPNVDVSSKGTIGLEVTCEDAFQANNGVRVAGNFDRPIIVYNDRAGTVINFDVDGDGAVRARGNVTPLTTGKTLGASSSRWDQAYVNHYNLGDGSTFFWNSSGDLTARSVEVRRNGGTPTIDFSNDSSTDFDARLILSGDDTLQVTGAKLVAAEGLGVGNSAAATTVGTVTRKMEVFDAAGSSLGFVPIYGTIT